MRAVRFSIAGLMGAVAGRRDWIGCVCAATRTHGPAASSGDAAALGLALVGAVCRRGEKRAWWLGFAVFGWIYMACAFAPYDLWPKLPTQILLDEVVDH